MIDIYRKLLTVDRLAGKHKLRKCDLASHSYFTALFFIEFAKKENIAYDHNVIETVMTHDLMEVSTADLPWPVKNLNETTKKCWETIEEEAAKAYPEFQKYSDENIKNSLNVEQFTLFKAMDYLELFTFIHEEIMLGNVTSEMVEIYERCVSLIEGKFKSVDEYMLKKFSMGKIRYSNIIS